MLVKIHETANSSTSPPQNLMIERLVLLADDFFGHCHPMTCTDMEDGRESPRIWDDHQLSELCLGMGFCSRGSELPVSTSEDDQ